MSKTDFLQTVEVLKTMTPAELGELQKIMVEKKISVGTTLFAEGEKASAMYFIIAGTIEIVKEGAAGTQLVVAQLGPGSHFGEMAFIDANPRAAAACVKTEVTVLEMPFDRLGKLLDEQPKIGSKLYQAIARALCSRIRRTTADLTSLLLS